MLDLLNITQHPGLHNSEIKNLAGLYFRQADDHLRHQQEEQVFPFLRKGALIHFPDPISAICLQNLLQNWIDPGIAPTQDSLSESCC